MAALLQTDNDPSQPQTSIRAASLAPVSNSPGYRIRSIATPISRWCLLWPYTDFWVTLHRCGVLLLPALNRMGRESLLQLPTSTCLDLISRNYPGMGTVISLSLDNWPTEQPTRSRSNANCSISQRSFSKSALEPPLSLLRFSH